MMTADPVAEDERALADALYECRRLRQNKTGEPAPFPCIQPAVDAVYENWIGYYCFWRDANGEPEEPTGFAPTVLQAVRELIEVQQA